MRVLLLKIIFPILALAAFVNTFYGVLYYTLISVIRPEQLTWGGAVISNVFAMAISTLVIACILKKEKLLDAMRQRFFIYFLLFIIALYFCTLLSPYTIYEEKRGSFYYLNQFPQIFAFCVCLYAVLARLSEAQFQKYLKLLLSFFLFMGVWGIEQYFRGNVLVERLFGGFIVDRCAITTVYILYFPLAVYFVLKKGRLLRAFGILSMLVCVTVIVLGQSRAGFLGLCVTLLGMFFYSKRKVVFAGVAGLALLAGLLFVSDAYVDRMKNIKFEDVESTETIDYSAASRQILWQMALDIFKDNPLKGVGFQNFAKASSKYGLYYKSINKNLYDYTFYEDGRSRLSHPHNTYLRVLAEGGLLVAVPFFLMLLVPLWRGHKLSCRIETQPNDRKLLINLLSCGILGVLVTGFFGGIAGIDYIYWNLTILSFLVSDTHGKPMLNECSDGVPG